MPKTRRNLLALAVATALPSLVLVNPATAAPPRSTVMPPPAGRSYRNELSEATGSLVSVEVLAGEGVRAGNFPIFQKENRYFVGAREGTPYQIAVRNRTANRLLVVMSVDGINAITGETASPDQAGYILEPRATMRIDGWRKSLREVALFRFAERGDSYAYRTERPDNTGVLGFAVFEEHAPVIAHSHSFDAREALARPSAALGTAHGERKTSVARKEEFLRARSVPSEVLRMEYTSLEELERRFIAVRSKIAPAYQRPGSPDPFPAASEFAPDPWR